MEDPGGTFEVTRTGSEIIGEGSVVCYDGVATNVTRQAQSEVRSAAPKACPVCSARETSRGYRQKRNEVKRKGPRARAR